jgi:hypothetical protein
MMFKSGGLWRGSERPWQVSRTPATTLTLQPVVRDDAEEFDPIEMN